VTDFFLLFRLLALLGLANGAPIVATALLKKRLDWPLDGGAALADGRRLLGEAKTIRGVVAAIGVTTFAAPLLGFDWRLGAALAAESMAGDLASSFVKRRLGLAAHAQALGLDQVPEALLPLLLLKSRLALGAVDVALAVIAFALVELLLSRWLFALRIREQPY